MLVNPTSLIIKKIQSYLLYTALNSTFISIHVLNRRSIYANINRQKGGQLKKSKNNKKGTSVKKRDLPTKVCPTCDRAFTWRKKWERDWDNVKYCSERCKRNKINEEKY